MLPTKHGQLYCLTRIVRFINWMLYEEDLSEQPIPSMSLSTLIEKEYGKTLLLDLDDGSDHYLFRAFSQEIDLDDLWRQDIINACLKDGCISGEQNFEVFLTDLIVKSILLPGDYIIYV